MVGSGLHKDSKCHLTAGNVLFSPHSAPENGTRSYSVDVHAVVLENFIKKYQCILLTLKVYFQASSFSKDIKTWQQMVPWIFGIILLES